MVHEPILGRGRTRPGTGSRRDPPCLRDMILAVGVAVLCVGVALDARAGLEVVEEVLRDGLCGRTCAVAEEGGLRNRGARACVQLDGWKLGLFLALTQSRTGLYHRPDRNGHVSLPNRLPLRLRRSPRLSPSTPPGWRSRE